LPRPTDRAFEAWVQQLLRPRCRVRWKLLQATMRSRRTGSRQSDQAFLRGEDPDVIASGARLVLAR